jgi:putative ABC transport system permease protein
MRAWGSQYGGLRAKFDVMSLMSDLRFTIRVLLKSPAFAITTLTALVLGIGANTAIFTLVHTTLIRQLPYPDSDRIVSIARQGGGRASVPMFKFWEENNPGFEDLTAYQAATNGSLNVEERTVSVEVIRASRNYFRLFGAAPVLGRTFTTREDAPGGAAVAVISNGLWKRRFNAEPSTIGKSLALAGIPYTIIGVLPERFYPYPAADVWIPLQADAHSNVQAHTLMAAARLPRGMTVDEAHSKMAVVGARYLQAHPEFLKDDKLEITSLQQRITGDIRSALLILLGAVGLVLLIACANVANLLLSRAAVRQKELAIRIAIGASYGRVVRQLLTESLLLAGTGGLLGLALGSYAIRAFLQWTPNQLARVEEMSSIPALDPAIAGFTVAVSVATAILFGLFPAIKLARASTKRIELKHDRRPHQVLISAEAAVAVVLLCGAGLLIHSLIVLHHVPLGFDPRNVLSIQISLVDSSYSKSDAVNRVAIELVERLKSIPGVESASIASALPLFGEMDMIFSIPGRPFEPGKQFHGDVQWRYVSRSYFDVLKTPLISGRIFSERETRPVVIINEAMAHQFWPNENPVGQIISIGSNLGPAFEQGSTEIIGIVSDERVRLGFDAVPVMYQLPSQIADASMELMNRIQQMAVLIRTQQSVPPFSIRQEAELQVSKLLPQPIGKVRTLNEARFDSAARENFNVLLLTVFASLALLLAGIGIYGVVSYNVGERSREIGIRTALGATRMALVRMIVTQAFRVTSIGVCVGIFGAAWITPVLRAQLYGVRPSDPMTFAAVPLILLLVTGAAAAVPAVRASRFEVVKALRHE